MNILSKYIKASFDFFSTFSSKEKIIFLLALFLFLFRFYSLGDVPFVVDEPNFQILLDHHFQTKTFPVVSFQGSSLRVNYGPAALWFYGIIRIFTAHPLAITLYHTLFFSLAFIALFFALKLLYGNLVACTGFLFATSSPLLYFLSRHPWDNTILIPLSGLLLACVAYLHKILELSRNSTLVDWEKAKSPLYKKTFFIFFLTSILTAFGFNLHLMFGVVMLSLAVALSYFLLQINFQPTEKTKLLLMFILVFILISLPYLLNITSGLENAPPLIKNSRWGDGRNLWWLFLRTCISASSWGIKNRLDPVLSDFYFFVGPFFTKVYKVDIFGWFPKVLAWGFIFYLFSAIFREKFSRLPLFTIYLIANFVFILLVYQYLNIPTEAHYFNSIWWIASAASALAITKINIPWLRKFLGFGFVLAITTNILFTFHAYIFIHQNTGTRGMNHGTAIMNIYSAAKEICGIAKLKEKDHLTVNLSKVYTQPAPFEFFTAHLENCAGINFEFTRDPNTKYADIIVSYSPLSTTSASLWLKINDSDTIPKHKGDI